MALTNSVVWANAIIMDYSKTVRNLREAGETFYNVEETIETQTLELRALTYAAAKAEVDANAQPDEPESGTATYTYKMSIENEIIGSYRLQRVYEAKDISFAEA